MLKKIYVEVTRMQQQPDYRLKDQVQATILHLFWISPLTELTDFLFVTFRRLSGTAQAYVFELLMPYSQIRPLTLLIIQGTKPQPKGDSVLAVRASI